MKIKQLEEFVNNTAFSQAPVDLDSCTKIIDQEKFAKSHLQTLKSNSGNRTFKTYYDRLVKFYKILNK